MMFSSVRRGSQACQGPENKLLITEYADAHARRIIAVILCTVPCSLNIR